MRKKKNEEEEALHIQIDLQIALKKMNWCEESFEKKLLWKNEEEALKKNEEEEETNWFTNCFAYSKMDWCEESLR